jgi:hypothetical protein
MEIILSPFLTRALTLFTTVVFQLVERYILVHAIPTYGRIDVADHHFSIHESRQINCQGKFSLNAILWLRDGKLKGEDGL